MTPLVLMKSGYVGSEDRWLQLWQEIVRSREEVIQQQDYDFDTQAVCEILSALESVLPHLEKGALSVKSDIYPKSLLDFYSSGGDFLLCEILDSLDGLKGYNNFFPLDKLITLKKLSKKIASRFLMVEGIQTDGTESWQHQSFDYKQYYLYRQSGIEQWNYSYEPNWVPLLKESLVVGLLNHGKLIWITPSQKTADGEWEAMIYSAPSDHAVDKYCSFAEMVFYGVICSLLFPSWIYPESNPVIDRLASILFDLDVLRTNREPDWAEWERIRPKLS